jgi:hypothetical protein
LVDMLSRRLFLSLSALALGRGYSRTMPPSPLTAALGGNSRARTAATYRVDATILLLGIPVFSRSGVGGGYAAIEEFDSVRSLQFAAGSDPARARGLNRLGFIHELRGVGGSRYFGFMTSSGEESFAEARRALEGPGSPEAQYTAISGEISGGTARSRVCRFAFPAHMSWADWDRLLPAACEAFHKSAAEMPQRTRACPARVGESFLAALYRVLEAGPGRAEIPFVYGARDLLLRTVVAHDAKIGLFRVEGKTLEGARTLSNFCLWYDSASKIPLRIELQPRSFLRLTLHADKDS